MQQFHLHKSSLFNSKNKILKIMIIGIFLDACETSWNKIMNNVVFLETQVNDKCSSYSRYLFIILSIDAVGIFTRVLAHMR